jgi:hypothetical protein
MVIRTSGKPVGYSVLADAVQKVPALGVATAFQGPDSAFFSSVIITVSRIAITNSQKVAAL